MNPPLSESDALRAFARMMNTLDVGPLEPLLADAVVYESQGVMIPLRGKSQFLAYMRPKLQAIANAGATVFAEIGKIRTQPCVVLAQYRQDNLRAVVVVKVSGPYIERLDQLLAPWTSEASRSGEYPGLVSGWPCPPGHSEAQERPRP